MEQSFQKNNCTSSKMTECSKRKNKLAKDKTNGLVKKSATSAIIKGSGPSSLITSNGAWVDTKPPHNSGEPLACGIAPYLQVRR